MCFMTLWRLIMIGNLKVTTLQQKIQGFLKKWFFWRQKLILWLIGNQHWKVGSNLGGKCMCQFVESTDCFWNVIIIVLKSLLFYIVELMHCFFINFQSFVVKGICFLQLKLEENVCFLWIYLFGTLLIMLERNKDFVVNFYNLLFQLKFWGHS